MPAAHVGVVGGGLAGLAVSVILAEQGLRVSLLERHPRLGGRATSYLLPSGEHIDNCQHVTLRCCTNLADFYKRIGVAGSIRYYDRLTFTDSKARRAEIRSNRLPAPLHLTPSFAKFPLLKWKDKRAIAGAMLRILRSGGRPYFNRPASMLKWLHENNQTQDAIDRFWRVVLVSALNEQLDRIDAAYGISVFWKAFLANPAGFGVGIPTVPLEDLYRGTTEHIRLHHGDVRTSCGASGFSLVNCDVAAVRLEDGSELKADYYVAAVSYDRLLKMLPSALGNSDGFAGIARLQASPITSVHMWLDRAVMKEAFLASVDQTIQWVFNKTMLGSEGKASAGQYLQVVISASHALKQLSQQDIIDLCRRELVELMPEISGVKFVRAVVVRENAATFSPEPGCDSWRPDTCTSIGNLFLAGDWTRTGWPATMESAVRSGYRAAEAILAVEGKPMRIVQPELPPTGLSAWFARRADRRYKAYGASL